MHIKQKLKESVDDVINHVSELWKPWFIVLKHEEEKIYKLSSLAYPLLNNSINWRLNNSNDKSCYSFYLGDAYHTVLPIQRSVDKRYLVNTYI